MTTFQLTESTDIGTTTTLPPIYNPQSDGIDYILSSPLPTPSSALPALSSP